MQAQVQAVQSERDDAVSQVGQLKGELDSTRSELAKLKAKAKPAAKPVQKKSK